MLSFWHILIVLVVVVILFGPGRIEKLGPSIGKAIRGFKDGLDGKDDNKKLDDSTNSSDTEKKS